MTATRLLAGLIVLSSTLSAQTPGPVCEDGRCRVAPLPAAAPVRSEWQVVRSIDKTTRELIDRARGTCRLRVTLPDRSRRLGSAVHIGPATPRSPGSTLSLTEASRREQGADGMPSVSGKPERHVLLTAGHVFAGLDGSSRVEVELDGRWIAAGVVDAQTTPDRAVLIIGEAVDASIAVVAQDDNSAGRAVMIGYPSGGEARAFLGTVPDSRDARGWMRLQRVSHFDCINGASGGGVYNHRGELVGIQSCTDSRGYVERVGYTPIAAWDALFAQLGWCPRRWGRGCRPIAAPQIAVDHDEVPEDAGRELVQLREQLAALQRAIEAIPRGPAGEPGPRGPAGPRGEPGAAGPAGRPISEDELQRAVAEYLRSHPPQIDRAQLERMVVGLLDERAPRVTDLTPLLVRLDAIEATLDVPFEVQLFHEGTKVGSPRSVRPHGGYLPLDVFGDIETITNR